MVEAKQAIKFQSKYLVNPDLPREYYAVAPMVDVSDKYFLFLCRLLTKHSTLYTQMLNEGALLNTQYGAEKLLGFMPMQKPVVC